MKLLFSILILTLSINLSAQQNSIFTNLKAYSSEGKVQIFQDADILVLMNDYINKKKSEKGMLGYRVQIFFASGHTARENANNIRNKFVSNYKDIPVYVVFEDPNFKVRVGDFRTKSEALAVLVQVEEQYKGAYIVKDFVKFAELD